MNKLKGGREQKAILNSIVLFAEDVYFLTKLEDNQLKKTKQNKPPQNKPALFSIFTSTFTDSYTTNTTSNYLVSTQAEGLQQHLVSPSVPCPWSWAEAETRTESCKHLLKPSLPKVLLSPYNSTHSRETRLSTADSGTAPGMQHGHKHREER